MASAVIHLCVAKKVNSFLEMDERLLSLGSIAPDISKLIGEDKNKSHFLDEYDNEDTPPNYDRFVNKYRKDLDKPFEMGYLIHLITDYYWFKDYVYKYIKDYTGSDSISYSAMKKVIYNDYTVLNQLLIDDYMLDLYYFMNEIEYPNSNIEEIPMDKLKVLIDKMGIIIENMSTKKNIMLDEKEIINFIEVCGNKVIDDLIRLKVIGGNYGKEESKKGK